MLDRVQEHEQLLNFLYAAPVGLIQASLDGKIELINSMSAKLLLPVAPQRTLANLFDALVDVVPDLQRRVLSSDKANCTVCDGLRFEVRPEQGSEARTVVVALSLNKVAGRRLVAVLSDITELVHHERALRESEALYQNELLRSQERLERKVDERTSELQCAKVELEQRASQAEAASRAKSDFLANMSHEIRTPLNAMLGNIELLRRDQLEPAQAQRVGQLKVAAEYLLGTLSDVLELSKIEAGELAIDEVDFVLDDVLHRTRAIVGHAASVKGLTLHIESQGTPQSLRGDPARLSQILVNYMSNAIKFTAKGGIRLAARLVADDANSCEIEFAVHDTGIGISPDSATELFAAFERGTSDRLTRGVGLGLAINTRLAQLMRGTVGAAGVPGRGSTFWLKVRFVKVATGTCHEQSQLSAEEILMRDHRGATVLVVEDEPMNQVVALEFLRDLGLEPALATDGVEAVQRVQSQDFSLVLMDLKMPRLDGLQATAAIRALPGRETLPILAMTANAFREDRKRCLDAGMNDFISKPFDVNRLCEALLRWLDSDRAQAR